MPSHTVVARKRSSLVSTNTLSLSSPRLSLILGVLLATTYPQAAAAAPGKMESRGDVRRSRKIHAHSSNLLLQPEAQPPSIRRRNGNLLRRDFAGERDRRTSPLDIIRSLFGPPDPFGVSNENGGGNNNNNNNDNHHTTSTARAPSSPPSSPTKTTTTSHAQTTAPSASQLAATSTTPPPSTSPSPSDSGINNGQSSNMDASTGSDLAGLGASNTQSQTHSIMTAQSPPPFNNGPYGDPGNGNTMSMPNGGQGNASSQSSATKGLVIGLVVSLVILVAFCMLGAFLLARRMRKKRREREESSPFNDTAPWIGSKGREQADDGYSTEKTETREESEQSHLSRAQSVASEQRMRARTPGGSSAVPVPYDPSEVSDDVSAHFTFFPQDDAIGVPVPYPLALHIPARVQKAMAERDARWQDYDDLQPQPYAHGYSRSTASGQTQSDIRTIPDRPDFSRRSTGRSMTDSVLSSTEGHGGMYFAPNSRLSSIQSGRNPDDILSRSDVGNNGHSVDNRSLHEMDGPDALTSPISVADFPIPPPPMVARRISDRRLRRTSAAPSTSISYSPRLLSVSENPFATNTAVGSTGSVTETERSLEEGTSAQHVEESRRASMVAERVTVRATPARTTVLRQSILRNPFDDAASPEDSRDSRRISSSTTMTELGSVRNSDIYAGVVEHATVDGHDSSVFAFPAPPRPVTRLP